MIFCIDGTGEHDDKIYYNDMKRGFCYHIHSQYKNSVYVRGPETFGTETWSIGNGIYEKIIDVKLRRPVTAPLLMNSPMFNTAGSTRQFSNGVARINLTNEIATKKLLVNDTPITLVGHSRGGAACIYVAHKLNEIGIAVNAMLLFDAVDRAIGFDTTTIPSNVNKCLHLMRDPEFANYFHNTPEYKELSSRAGSLYLSHSLSSIGMGTTLTHGSPMAQPKPNPDLLRLLKLDELHKKMKDMCRVNCLLWGVPTGFGFDNTGTKWSGKTDYKSEKFMATHGALGGAPLQTSKEIDDQRYWGLIAEAEVLAMFQVQARAKSFLTESGETGELKLGYQPLCTTRDQTAF